MLKTFQKYSIVSAIVQWLNTLGFGQLSSILFNVRVQILSHWNWELDGSLGLAMTSVCPKSRYRGRLFEIQIDRIIATVAPHIGVNPKYRSLFSIPARIPGRGSPQQMVIRTMI